MKTTFLSTFVLLFCSAFAQEQKIVARIVEQATEKPIPEVKVILNDGTKTTFTNHLGWFELAIDRANINTLTLSHIAYKILQVEVPSQERFKLYLEKDTVHLRPLNLNDYTVAKAEAEVNEVTVSMDETDAKFPGGLELFYEKLGVILQSRLTAVADKGFITNFTITESGQPVDIAISDPAVAVEVLEAFQTLPPWIPATQHQRPVKQYFKLSIYRYTKVELQPEDLAEFKAFVNKQIKYPGQARRIGVEGPTFTKFAVDETGNVINIILLQGLEQSCNDEIKRIISLLPAHTLKNLSDKSHAREFILPVFFGLDKPIKKGRVYELSTNAYMLPPVDVMAGGLTVVRREIGGSARVISGPVSRPIITTFTNLSDALANTNMAERLTLRNNNLKMFPADILKLTNLVFLDLEQNQIGSLPNDINVLQNLEELYLLQNKMVALPANVSRLEKLRILGLANNQLSSFPEPITSLDKLKVLDLSNNQLTEIPTTIKQMKNLETLLLMNNKITHIPSELLELKRLKKIYLNGNPIDLQGIELLKKTLKKTEIGF